MLIIEIALGIALGFLLIKLAKKINWRKFLEGLDILAILAVILVAIWAVIMLIASYHQEILSFALICWMIFLMLLMSASALYISGISLYNLAGIMFKKFTKKKSTKNKYSIILSVSNFLAIAILWLMNSDAEDWELSSSATDSYLSTVIGDYWLAIAINHLLILMLCQWPLLVLVLMSKLSGKIDWFNKVILGKKTHISKINFYKDIDLDGSFGITEKIFEKKTWRLLAKQCNGFFLGRK